MITGMKANQFYALTVPIATTGLISGAKGAPNNLEVFCRYSQSDDCIHVDSSDFLWDSEPSLNPRWNRIKKLPIRRVDRTRVAQTDGLYYCTRSTMQERESYLRCTKNGWVFESN